MSAPNPPNTNAASTGIPKFVGKYKIIRMIARSNDIVYEAVDPHLGRHIALKELILSPDLSGAARRERIERFQREAKAAGALKHPNIVTIYEVGQHLDHRFIAMEYLEGQTLREVMTVCGPMSIHDALKVALQLCDALGYAHAQGVVHRDVKPDNIHLVPPNSTVKLTDFGIARVLTEPSITSAGQVFGTPSYMSPEQLTSRQVDHRSDLFSLAVVIYEMVVGKKPFRGDNVLAVTYNIMNTEVTMPPSVPPGLASILSRALIKDPDLRYQNMRSLAVDLRHELAFHDSPHNAPAPRATSERTMVIAPSGLPQPDADPTTFGTSSHGGQAAVSAVSISDEPASRPTSPTSGSLLTAIDTDERVREAVLKLGVSAVLTLLLLCVTAWSFMQCVHRLADNSRHTKALVAYRSAVAAATAGNYSMAIGKYQSALRTAGLTDSLADLSLRGMSDCYTAEGVHAQSVGDMIDAQESYTKAVATSYNNPVAHYDLAMLYKADGDQLDALREFTQAHQIDPNSLAGVAAKDEAQQGYLKLAEQNYAGGNASRARQSWQRVIDLDPSSPAADQARTRISQLPQ